jgi:hypothetical protein
VWPQKRQPAFVIGSSCLFRDEAFVLRGRPSCSPWWMCLERGDTRYRTQTKETRTKETRWLLSRRPAGRREQTRSCRGLEQTVRIRFVTTVVDRIDAYRPSDEYVVTLAAIVLNIPNPRKGDLGRRALNATRDPAKQTPRVTAVRMLGYHGWREIRGLSKGRWMLCQCG